MTRGHASHAASATCHDMALPTPNAALTIPSLHDSIEILSRVYYPRKPKDNTGFFGRGFAVLAHPYAPLGGSYDDPVVALIGTILLQNGIVLVTFNFRGAEGAAGRTSWSGKAELADYVSVYVFVVGCMQAVRDFESGSPLTLDTREDAGPLLILGGYSYGSMIASCLPPLEIVEQVLRTADEDSAANEIKLRAHNIGRDLAAFIAMHRDGTFLRGRQSSRNSEPTGSPGHKLKVGGYESEAASSRVSRESSRRSLDTERIRHSIDRARHKFRIRTKSGESTKSVRSVAEADEKTIDRIEARIAYILVSPLLGPIIGLTTMFRRPSFELRDSATGHITMSNTSTDDSKFLTRPTCFIYGTRDHFTSHKKLRKWADALHGQASSTFASYEIDGAGHFWTETGVSARLRSSVANWLLVLAKNTT